MENNKTPIEESLGLPYYDPISQIKNDINDNSTLKDFDTARANIKSILTVGSDAITNLGALAFQSQDPETYTALSKLIKDVTDASTKLLDLHERLENITNKKSNKNIKMGEDNPDVVNLYFSTSDVFKAIKEMDQK